MRFGFFLLIFLLLISFPSPGWTTDSSIFTLWPLLDHRSSARVEYSSTHLAGPFLKYETKADETETAFRPFIYRAADAQGLSRTEIFYPLATIHHERERTSAQVFQLLSYDFGQDGSASRNQFTLFPFLFYGQHDERGEYFAFFPFGGRLYGWLQRDEITFALFPLYSYTRRDTTRVDNLLWPFFARIQGDDEAGFKIWPLYGQSRKEGHYRKRFMLWPFFFSNSLDLETDTPVEERAFWPFWFARETRDESYQSILWPLFSRRDDRADRVLDEWFPWPLVRRMQGDTKYGSRILPFYADETLEANRQRWYLWPLYKIEELSTELVDRRRDRILYFLYSDTVEKRHETGSETRRIALWPLFGYQDDNRVRHLHALALLEPFFPGNEGIEHSWAPLWRIYQQKWDRAGNRVASFLWNLFWYEGRGSDVTWELFPLVSYRNELARGLDVELFKGLFHYREDRSGKQLNLFYLPWGISWAALPGSDQRDAE